MGINRQMRRQKIKELPYEERKLALAAQQRAQRVHAAHEVLRKHYQQIALDHTPAWALWLSRHMPPKWYVRFFHAIVDNCPPIPLMLWLASLRMSHSMSLALFTLVKLPGMLIGVVISTIFLMPFIPLRKWLADFGLSAKAYEQDAGTHKLVIKKFGRVLCTLWVDLYTKEVRRANNYVETSE